MDKRDKEKDARLTVATQNAQEAATQAELAANYAETAEREGRQAANKGDASAAERAANYAVHARRTASRAAAFAYSAAMLAGDYGKDHDPNNKDYQPEETPAPTTTAATADNATTAALLKSLLAIDTATRHASAGLYDTINSKTRAIKTLKRDAELARDQVHVVRDELAKIRALFGLKD